MSSENRLPAASVTTAALILGAASLISRLLGLLRDRILAGQFGAGDVLDAYYLAFRVPDFIYNLIFLGAISAGFIPIFSKYLHRDKDDAWKLANGILNILLLIIALFSLIIFISSPWIIPLLAPGFSAEKLDLAIKLNQIIAFSPILLGISSLFSSVLQTQGRFIWYSLPPIFYNVGIIIGAVVLTKFFGPIGLGWGVLLGAALHLLIQLPGLIKSGYTYKFGSWKHSGVKELLKLTLPRAITLGLNQISLIILTFFAAALSSGNLAVFNFANNLVSLPVGIVGISFAIAIFPALTNAAVTNKLQDFRTQLSSSIRQIFFFVLPLAVIFILLRVQIVRVALGSGHFDWQDTIATMQALGYFSLGLLAYNLTPSLIRAFYAMEDTKTPMYVAIGSTITTALMAWLLVGKLRLDGLALAYAIKSWVEALALFVLLKIKVGNIDARRMATSLLSLLSASFFMAVALQATKYIIAPFLNFQSFTGIFFHGLISGSVGIIVYLFFCWIFGSPEFTQLREGFSQKLASVNKKVLPASAEPQEEEVLR